jgi:hypothetical protein
MILFYQNGFTLPKPIVISDIACARRLLSSTSWTISKHFSLVITNLVSDLSVSTSKMIDFLSSLEVTVLITCVMNSVCFIFSPLSVNQNYYPRLVGVHSQSRCERVRNLRYDYKSTYILLS